MALLEHGKGKYKQIGIIGMIFDLGEEEQKFQKSVRNFMKSEVEPRVRDLGVSGAFPYDIFRKMGKLGLLGTPISREYGGSGGSFLSYALQMEEFARVDLGLHGIVQVHLTMAGLSFYLFGTEEQKKQYLLPMVRGEQLGAFGLTEPNAGSDAGSIRTKAVMHDESWIVNGSKNFITNSGTDISNGVLILAITGKDKNGRNELSSLFIPKGTPGYIVAPKNRMHCFPFLDNHNVSFEDCKITKNNLVGELGKGLQHFMRILDYARTILAAGSVGAIQRCLEEALEYSRSRVQFNQAICNFQSIQNKLADMALNLELARLMTYKAASFADEGRRFTKEAAFAKLFASEAAEKASSEAVQIFGGYGFMEEYSVGRFFRDVKVHSIGEGTSEIMRMVIARSL